MLSRALAASLRVIRRQVGVSLCHLKIIVPQQFFDRLQLNAFLNQHARVVMPEVLKPEALDPGLFQEVFETV